MLRTGIHGHIAFAEDGHSIPVTMPSCYDEKEADYIPQIQTLLALEKLILWLARPPKHNTRLLSVSILGRRVLAMLAVVRPDLLNGISIAELARKNHFSKSWLNLIVSQFRDEFGGIKNGAMRSESYRTRQRETTRRGHRRKHYRLRAR
jgi:hypothetical protein